MFRIAVKACLTLIIILTYFVVSFGSFSKFFWSLDHCPEPFCDYVYYFYEMGKEIFISGKPTLGYYYTPFFAIFLGIFALLDLKISIIVWVIFQIFVFFALVMLTYKVFSPARPELINLLLIVFVTSFPILHNFKWGQVGVIIVLLIVSALYAHQKKHPVLCASLIAASVAIKYYTVVFLLYFILKREWKILIFSIIMLTSFFFIIPSLFIGIGGTIEFYRSISQNVFVNSVQDRGVNSHYIVNVFSRYFHLGETAGKYFRTFMVILSYAVIFGNLILMSNLIRFQMEEKFRLGFIILFLSVPFFVATCWPHYLVYLPICQYFLMRYNLENSGAGMRAWLGWSLILGSFLLSNIVFFNFFGSWETYNALGFLFWANFLLLLFIYIRFIPVIKSYRIAEVKGGGSVY